MGQCPLRLQPAVGQDFKMHRAAMQARTTASSEALVGLVIRADVGWNGGVGNAAQNSGDRIRLKA